MNKKWKWLIVIVLIGVAGIGLLFSEKQKISDTKNMAPDFTVVDSEGKKVKLSDFRGKPVVLNFWASWCPPCKAEMPHFQKVYSEMKSDVAFMMVDCVDGRMETMEKGKQYIEKSGYSFPVYFDTDGEAAYFYGISAIPTTFFINADGKIETNYQGAISEKQLRSAIGLIQKGKNGT